MGLGATCGHGKTWKEPCNDCRMVSITEALRRMVPHVEALKNEQAALYAQGVKPFTAVGEGGHS